MSDYDKHHPYDFYYNGLGLNAFEILVFESKSSKKQELKYSRTIKRGEIDNVEFAEAYSALVSGVAELEPVNGGLIVTTDIVGCSYTLFFWEVSEDV